MRAHAQSGGGACGAQVFQDGLVAVQGAARPVLADLAEQAVFDGIPLRRGRRVVGHGHAQAMPVAEAVLQVVLPGARRGTIAAAAVGQDLQRFGLGIVLAALGAPPFLDAVDGERRGVGGLADEDGAGIGPRVVDTVGDGEALGLGAEVVVLDPFGAAIPCTFPNDFARMVSWSRAGRREHQSDPCASSTSNGLVPRRSSHRWMPRGEFAPLSASTGTGRHRGCARSISAEGRLDLKLGWFAGIDWGSQTHQACVLDGAGKVLGERAFEHGGSGLSQMADWLLSFAAGDAGEVGVAIETPRGPVVESLMEHGFAVHSINPKQLDRFRDRFSPAGAKDDRRDARVLAAALRTDPHCLRRLVPTDPAIVELRECLCGVAPVTRRSGKSLIVTRRLATHERLRDAAYHWARVAAQRDPVSHAKYQALRTRGHGHARALRSVADRLLNVACAMLRDGACFDPHRVGIATT